ncbi:MAG: hypothetical protein ACXVBE_07700 [Bdellovibrionota bacterium]
MKFIFNIGLIAIFLSSSLAAAEEKEISIEDFLQGLSTVQGVVLRKDPFIQAAPPFETPRLEAGNANIPVLERYGVNSYIVVAVLLGEQYPRALIRLPATENNKVVIVKEHDKLGNKGGSIIKIAKEGITVLQNQRSPLGFVDKTEVKIPVGDPMKPAAK